MQSGEADQDSQFMISNKELFWECKGIKINYSGNQFTKYFIYGGAGLRKLNLWKLIKDRFKSQRHLRHLTGDKEPYRTVP
jgi:hypothetical protein